MREWRHITAHICSCSLIWDKEIDTPPRQAATATRITIMKEPKERVEKVGEGGIEGGGREVLQNS